MGLILPNLRLRLLPVLNGSPVLAASLLVQRIGTLGDLWVHVDGFPGHEVKNAPFDHRDPHGVIKNQAGYHGINKYREHLPPRQRLKSGETDERRSEERDSIRSESR